MNRRRFIQSLVAVFSLPTSASLSLGSATAAIPTAAAVPANARFWAIYMSALHGECTPQTMQNLLHIPAVDAKKYVGQLIAEGVIKPNPLLKQTVSKVLKSKDDGLLGKVKKRLEMKEQGMSGELNAGQTINPKEPLDNQRQTAAGPSEAEATNLAQGENAQAEFSEGAEDEEMHQPLVEESLTTEKKFKENLE